ncbi:cysteine desulfurase family protein [Plebeiibacterium sediminum]|uniref:cysteine desulfurase n=1 Tax=Plebeiibacterium sediminum TaxID=2992112 RepID=A0AAE3M7N1_9BACT|nr:cysteine desulfurase family protein [Plebeiobacterium sediminum]MCW3788496.1 cysteine desulfurase [Plebeiobacterium sediminum]
MNISEHIYLDYAASTPTLPEVVEEVLPYMVENFSNPSNGIHNGGKTVAQAIEKATTRIQKLIGAWDYDVIYTSGATEGLNMTLKGLYLESGHHKKQIITCKTEHKAVLAVCDYLTELGAEISYVDVNIDGELNYDQLKQLISENTLAVCLMAVNNETGVIHDIDTISSICLQNNVKYICDGTQAVGKLPLNIEKTPIDALIFSGHKMYAPKGIGAVVLKRSFKIHPLIHGGGQQNDRRSGTLNVPGIVGLGKAAEILTERITIENDNIRRLQKLLEGQLTKEQKSKIIGAQAKRSPYISNIYFHLNEHEEIIFPLSSKIYFSTGSACTSEIIEPSHVLRAMGMDSKEADRCLRFSFGIQTTENEVKEAIDLIKKELNKV